LASVEVLCRLEWVGGRPGSHLPLPEVEFNIDGGTLLSFLMVTFQQWCIYPETIEMFQ
jgi:hypothetical protein